MKAFIFAIVVLATIALAKGRSSSCSFSAQQTCIAAKAELDDIAGIIEEFMPADLVARLNASISSTLEENPDTFSPRMEEYSPRMKEHFMSLRETLHQFNESAVETNNMIVKGLKETTEKITGAKDCLDQLRKLEKANKRFSVACAVADDYQAITSAFKQAAIQEYQKFKMSLDDLDFVNRMAQSLNSGLENGIEAGEDFVNQLESEFKSLMRNFKGYQSVTRNMGDKAVTANEKLMKLAQDIIASPSRNRA